MFKDIIVLQCHGVRGKKNPKILRNEKKIAEKLKKGGRKTVILLFT